LINIIVIIIIIMVGPVILEMFLVVKCPKGFHFQHQDDAHYILEFDWLVAHTLTLAINILGSACLRPRCHVQHSHVQRTSSLGRYAGAAQGAWRMLDISNLQYLDMVKSWYKLQGN
jgi:hypothetical protein